MPENNWHLHSKIQEGRTAKCSASDMTFGGRCLACGFDPDIKGICPNCGQWQRGERSDCMNDCHKRGFA